MMTDYIYTDEDKKIRKKWLIVQAVCLGLFAIQDVVKIFFLGTHPAFLLESLFILLAIPLLGFYLVYHFAYKKNGTKLLSVQIAINYLGIAFLSLEPLASFWFLGSALVNKAPSVPEIGSYPDFFINLSTQIICLVLSLVFLKFSKQMRDVNRSVQFFRRLPRLEKANNLKELDKEFARLLKKCPNHRPELQLKYAEEKKRFVI